MMLAAPEFVIAERIELLDEVEVAAELQHRMLADWVMRGEEGSEFEASHLFPSGGLLLLLVCCAGYVLNGSRAIAEGPGGLCGMAPCVQPMDRRGCQAWAKPDPLANLHLRVLRLRECPIFPFEAAMYLKQSEAAASLRLSS